MVLELPLLCNRVRTGISKREREGERHPHTHTHTHTHNEKRYYLIITSAWEFLVSTVIRSLDQYYIWANIIYEPILYMSQLLQRYGLQWSRSKHLEFSFPLYVHFNLSIFDRVTIILRHVELDFNSTPRPCFGLRSCPKGLGLKGLGLKFFPFEGDAPWGWYSLRVILLEGDTPWGRCSSLDTWSGDPAVGRVTS